MERSELASVLERYKSGELRLEGALEALSGFPSDALGYANLDTQRRLRTGFPEVVYCAGKSPEQLRGILARLLEGGSSILATRAGDEHLEAARGLGGELACDPVSRTISLRRGGPPAEDGPLVAVVTAGTSDLRVAEEAAVTVSTFGHRLLRVQDVGVAGLHRLLGRLGEIREADAVIAVAGMEGALASVLGGLVAAPVIAVPTSVGYGASLGGLAALLAMLNSCSAVVTVVNIDNGFGAGCAASAICERILRPPLTSRRGTS